MFIEERRRVPIVDDADVVVIGGGPSGFAAALAAAREGVDVILIEKYGFLGGVATAAGVNFFMPTKTVKGIYSKVLKELKQYGATNPTTIYPEVLKYLKKCKSAKSIYKYLSRMLKDGTVTKIWMRGSGIIFNPVYLRYIMLRMLLDNDVKLKLHTLACGVIKKNNVIKFVVTESKSGREAIKGKIFVDASGDADIAYLSGVPCVKSKSMQPMSLVFTMQKIGKIVKPSLPKGCKKYKSEKELPHSKIILPMDKDGRILVNMTRIKGDGTNADDLTNAEIEGLKQVFSVAFYLQTHGFEKFRLDSLPTQVGVRETRQIVGEYVLTKDDIIKGNKFKDVIAVGDYVIDIHEAGSREFKQYPVPPYQIPYRCLLPKKIKNLIVVGRCISATHEAMSSFRIMPICMAIGEAGGTAAAMAAKSRKNPKEVNVKLLQKKLLKNEAFLGMHY